MSELKWQDAVSYSHNFAIAKPNISPMEKEHILGLSKVLERIGGERDDLYAALSDLIDEYDGVLNSPYCQCSEDYEITDKARAALAKARGEQP